MPTEILRPNAAGDECAFPSQGGCSSCPNHYTCVNEEIADGGTYIYAETNDYRDLYNLPNSSGLGTIDKITLYFRVFGGASNVRWKGVIKSNSTVSDTVEKDPYGDVGDQTYKTYSQDWVTNPADSEAWEWADIDALQIGVAFVGAVGAWGRCTQVYVEIAYTESPTHTITASAGVNGIIEPSGAVQVTDGNDQLFTMTPNGGYDIYEILIDGTPI